DVPGATGPTAALNLKSAMKDYAEDRWRLIDYLKGQAELKTLAEAMAGALERATNALEKELGERADESIIEDELIAWLGEDYGRMTIAHLIRLRQSHQTLTAFREWQGGRS